MKISPYIHFYMIKRSSRFSPNNSLTPRAGSKV